MCARLPLECFLCESCWAHAQFRTADAWSVGCFRAAALRNWRISFCYWSRSIGIAFGDYEEAQVGQNKEVKSGKKVEATGIENKSNWKREIAGGIETPLELKLSRNVWNNERKKTLHRYYKTVYCYTYFHANFLFQLLQIVRRSSQCNSERNGWKIPDGEKTLKFELAIPYTPSIQNCSSITSCERTAERESTLLLVSVAKICFTSFFVIFIVDGNRFAWII